MRVHRLVAFTILLSVVRFVAFAEDHEKNPAPVANTKLEVFFSELETQWLKAQQDKDPAALNKIVADDFHLVTPAPPGKPISRSDWLLAIFGRRLLSFEIRQLAVREVSPTVSVVSFIQTETYQQTAAPQTENHFVVDIWVNSGAGDNWRCTNRYFSEAKGVPQKQIALPR